MNRSVYLPAVLFALLVNIGLFWAMQRMVTGESATLDRSVAEPLMVDFIRLKAAPPPPPPELLDEPDQPPPTSSPSAPQPQRLTFKQPGNKLPNWDTPKIDIPLNIGSGPYLGAFRPPAMPIVPPSDPIPLVRFAPRYPQRALLRHVEGSVTLNFTITADGTVSDPEVLKAEPVGYFEQAALRAIRRWKFQPKVEDGIAVSRSASQTIRFTMKKK